MRTRPATAVSIVFAWVAITTFSGVLIETLLIYPNIFADVPTSLVRGTAFFSEVGPGDVFPVLGLATLVTGVATIAVTSRLRAARFRALAAVAVTLAGEFGFSAWFFWPRNTVMFVEGPAVHAAGELVRVAWEFETGHWLRLALCGVTAVLASSALLRVLAGRGEAAAPVREVV
ncbi:DUF1772 domain-containing protein [Pseudonocardia nantongensis]|uniref:DUF1772 domain-containing protein n=1 Tax=Pseudonocardia nantongensis TaxID=1181885 RepID=UPI003979BFFA